MPVVSDEIRDASSARAVAETYEVSPGIYILGSLSTGVTVYRQNRSGRTISQAL